MQQKGRSTSPTPARWRRFLFMLVPAGSAAIVYVFLSPRGAVPAALLAGVVFLLGCGLFHPPSRHRRHGWGQVQQAVDHQFGVFGRSYPEDTVEPPTREPPTREAARRNDPCPCGSGRKYEKCCGH
jgi:hypothetical protein